MIYGIFLGFIGQVYEFFSSNLPLVLYKSLIKNNFFLLQAVLCLAASPLSLAYASCICCLWYTPLTDWNN